MSAYVGIDVHRRRSQIAIVEPDGTVRANRNVTNSPELVLSVIGDLPAGTPVAFEAAYGWGWLVELLDGYGFEPHLVHPLRCKAIASARLKNDKVGSLSLTLTIRACIGGGWAVDALIGTQTREHSDLDLWLPAADLDPLIAAFSQLGIDRVLPWGGDRPWNFVLHDGEHLRVDLHLYEELAKGAVHYGSVLSGDRFTLADLHGEGQILDTAVRCEAPEWALRCHTGYTPRAVDYSDVTHLCARFGLPLPGLFRTSKPNSEHGQVR